MKSEMVEVTAEQRDALFKFAFEKRAQATGRSAALNGAGWGALAGAGLGLLNHYSTPKDEDEPELKRLLLHILGGATLGGVAGAGLNYLGVPKAVANAATQAVATDPPPAKPVDTRPKEQIYQDKVNNSWDSFLAWYDRNGVGTHGKRGLIGAGTGAAGYEGTGWLLRLLDAPIAHAKSRGKSILTNSSHDLNELVRNPSGTIGGWVRDRKDVSDIKNILKAFNAGTGDFSALAKLVKSRGLLDRAKAGDREAMDSVIKMVKDLDLRTSGVKPRNFTQLARNPNWFMRRILGINARKYMPTSRSEDLALTVAENAIRNAEKAQSKVISRSHTGWTGGLGRAMHRHRVGGYLGSAVLGAILGAAQPVNTQAQTPSADTQDLRD